MARRYGADTHNKPGGRLMLRLNVSADVTGQTLVHPIYARPRTQKTSPDYLATLDRETVDPPLPDGHYRSKFSDGALQKQMRLTEVLHEYVDAVAR